MNYKKILKRSWQISKTYKFLWVFGMALAALSGGNFNSNIQLASDLFKEDNKSVQFPPIPTFENLPQSSSQILGATTDKIKDIFSNIPVSIWIIFGVSLVLFFLVVFLISFYIREWARGALIASIHNLEDSKPTDLYSGSLSGMLTAKKYILLHILPAMIFFFLIFILSSIFILLMSIIKNSLFHNLVKIFSGFMFFALFVIGGVMLVLTIIISEQLIIRKNFSIIQSLKEGFNLARNYFFQMLGIGLIHLGLGCAIGCLVLFIIIFLLALIGIAFTIGKQIGFIAVLVFGAPIVAFFLLSILISGIIHVFKTSNWTLLYREIEKLQMETNRVKK